MFESFFSVLFYLNCTVLLGLHKKTGCCTWKIKKKKVHRDFQNTFTSYFVFPRQGCCCSGILKMVPDVVNANNRSCVYPFCILRSNLGIVMWPYLFAHAWAFPDLFFELLWLVDCGGGWKKNMGQDISVSLLLKPLVNPKVVVLGACRASYQELEHNLPLRIAVLFSNVLTLVGGLSVGKGCEVFFQEE